MHRLTRWGIVSLLVALGLPSAAAATTCSPLTPSPIVRFATTFGNIDVQLNSADAACTVTNFMYYVDHDLYNATFIHRSVSSATKPTAEPDVIQGGGYTFVNGDPVSVPTQPAIANEYKDPNVRGSLAMALSGSNPASAQSQWFFNVQDNSEALDPQAFTVFGKVLSPAGLAVMDEIAAAPVEDFSTALGSSVFSDVPVTGGYVAGTGSSPAKPTAANLIFVKSISVLTDTTPPLVTISSPGPGQHYNLGQKVAPRYACNDGAGTGVESCSGATAVDTTLYGTLQYSVTATDYTGNTSTKTISYVVELPPSLTSVSTVSETRFMYVNIHCPASVACTGVLTLTAGKARASIGTAGFNIAAGRTSKLRVRLNPSADGLLRAGKGRLASTLVLAPNGAGSETQSQRVTLHLQPPKKPKKHKPPKHKKKKKKKR